MGTTLVREEGQIGVLQVMVLRSFVAWIQHSPKTKREDCDDFAFSRELHFEIVD